MYNLDLVVNVHANFIISFMVNFTIYNITETS